MGSLSTLWILMELRLDFDYSISQRLSFLLCCGGAEGTWGFPSIQFWPESSSRTLVKWLLTIWTPPLFCTSQSCTECREPCWLRNTVAIKGSGISFVQKFWQLCPGSHLGFWMTQTRGQGAEHLVSVYSCCAKSLLGRSDWQHVYIDRAKSENVSLFSAFLWLADTPCFSLFGWHSFLSEGASLAVLRVLFHEHELMFHRWEPIVNQSCGSQVLFLPGK